MREIASCFLDPVFLVVLVGLLLQLGCSRTGKGAASGGKTGSQRRSTYLREGFHDTSVGPDEALVNVCLAVDRWPNCTTLESAVEDMIRIEGAVGKSDEEKALATWKWFRLLVAATSKVASVPGGFYAHEGPKGQERVVFDPHKIIAVYGVHMCDGLSWALAGLWRAGGYMAFDECTWGHTTAALRYRDRDGEMRFHSFDPNGRFFYWDKGREIISTRSMPVMSGMVYRHLTAPRELHSLRTSLRIGETVERRWDNSGHIVAQGKDKLLTEKAPYFKHRPGRTDGLYALAGEEVQVLEASIDPEAFAGQLYAGSQNTSCSQRGGEGPALHPTSKGRESAFVYRLAPPYVIADATVEATLVKGCEEDICRLLFSLDGETWQPLFTKQKPGTETVTVNVGRKVWLAGQPSAFTFYDLLIKAEFRSNKAASRVGMDALKVTVHRQLNKRALPNLRPGENWLRVTAEELKPGQALELQLNYRLKGKAKKVVRHITEFPHYFKVDVPGASGKAREKPWDHDKYFNDGDLQMGSISMRLVPAAAKGADPSLPAAEGRAKFAASSPYPANMIDKKFRKRCEKRVAQTSGFFPQRTRRLDDDEAMNALIKQLKTTEAGKQWKAADALGDYPKATDLLIEALPKANIDLTLFIAKALAQIGDEKAVKPLLEKWKEGQAGAPGARYIPDALAAIGDGSVVPALIAPLKKVRLDFRFHIIHALGILGGKQAEAALADLAENDPLRANREFAAEQLEVLKRRKR